MAYVEITKAQIFKDAAGEYRWRTLGGNGAILGNGEGYADKRNAEASLEAHLPDGEVLIEDLTGDDEVISIDLSPRDDA